MGEMMGMFLSQEDVCVLTGKKRSGAQIRVLRQMSIPFFVNASGRPVVPRSVIDGSVVKAPKSVAGWQPDFAKLR